LLGEPVLALLGDLLTADLRLAHVQSGERENPAVDHQTQRGDQGDRPMGIVVDLDAVPDLPGGLETLHYLSAGSAAGRGRGSPGSHG